MDEVAFQEEVVAVLKKSLEGADVSKHMLSGVLKSLGDVRIHAPSSFLYSLQSLLNTILYIHSRPFITVCTVEE